MKKTEFLVLPCWSGIRCVLSDKKKQILIFDLYYSIAIGLSFSFIMYLFDFQGDKDQANFKKLVNSIKGSYKVTQAAFHYLIC